MTQQKGKEWNHTIYTDNDRISPDNDEWWHETAKWKDGNQIIYTHTIMSDDMKQQKCKKWNQRILHR